MYALYRGWSDAYLDYPMLDNHVRIDVRAWAVLEEITDQYYVRPRSLRFLANYVSKVGLRGVWPKMVSRLKERGRNEKYVSIGFGIISEVAPEVTAPKAGSFVAFLATNHPRCVDRVVIDQRFVFPLPSISGLDEGTVLYYPSLDIPSSETLKAVRGWLPYSGCHVESQAIGALLRTASQALERCVRKRVGVERLPVQRPTIIRDTVEVVVPRRTAPGKPKGALFGLGQYAKVFILPNVRTLIDVQKVHEIDPIQIGPVHQQVVDLDTHPFPRNDECFDVYFIAGYHHLHAPIAVAAIKRSAYAVVEKPLATSYEQLEDVEKALQGARSQLFVCFHKRYTAFNSLIQSDLQVHPGDPVNYYGLVHEMPLPRSHWYTWPKSVGHIVYNGCNWIDHFFFLNDYAPMREQWAYKMPSGDTAVVICLENGACGTITMSAFGSSRNGLRDYVEVTTTSGIARITDGKHYVSESTHRVIRKARENHMELYRNMYRRIVERITARKEGDPERSLSSTRCVLDLQNQMYTVGKLIRAG